MAILHLHFFLSREACFLAQHSILEFAIYPKEVYIVRIMLLKLCKYLLSTAYCKYVNIKPQ